jgi:hypothetical protein
LAGEFRTIIFRAGRDEGGKLVGVQAEPVRLANRDRDRRAADPVHQRFVDGVARIRNDDLVAVVDERLDRVEHDALAAHRDEDGFGSDREALASGGVVGDRGPQLGNAGVRRVVGLALVERPLGRRPDVGRGVEVGLADLEMDHVDAGCLERAGTCGRLERGLRPDALHSTCESHL